MKPRPIQFTQEEIPSLRSGVKTQMRIAMLPQPDFLCSHHNPVVIHRGMAIFRDASGRYRQDVPLPHNVGDILWVREKWMILPKFDDTVPSALDPRAAPIAFLGDPDAGGRLRSASHMPIWASRMSLDVTEVRVLRLQEITLGDICSEGIARSIYDFTPVQRGFGAFAAHWNGLTHRPGTRWEDDPWIAAVSFTIRHQNVEGLLAEQKVGDRAG